MGLGFRPGPGSTLKQNFNFSEGDFIICTLTSDGEELLELTRIKSSNALRESNNNQPVQK
jgi:hypothetical protein